jgi:hypothetical protein
MLTRSATNETNNDDGFVVILNGFKEHALSDLPKPILFHI